jgi:arachidonate 15-lipoxygenase
MVLLRDIISDIFACLGPLRSCEEPIQQYIVDPVQEYVLDPTIDYCIDPARNALSINPCGCIPPCGGYPTLPQDDSPAQQDQRVAQLGRAKSTYQYNYELVRSFHNGEPGIGIACADSVPLAQFPALCWITVVLQNALIVLDNLILILEMVAKAPTTPPEIGDPTKKLSAEGLQSEGEEEDDPDLAAVTWDISPEEVEQHKADVHALRANLLGTLVWGRSVTNGLHRNNEPDDVTDGVLHPWTISAPAHQQPAASEGSSLCPCPQCSPEAITRDMVNDLNAALGEIVRRIMMLPGLDRLPKGIKAYNDLFQRIQLPSLALWFQNDEMFAQQRIAGQNPIVLERVKWTSKLAKRFPVTDEQYREVMGKDDSLEEAGEDGRLYLCDYDKSLSPVVDYCGKFPPLCVCEKGHCNSSCKEPTQEHPCCDVHCVDRSQKYINAPLLLLALLESDRRIIRAVAIQVGQDPKKNPLFTPPKRHGDDRFWNWEIAKTIVQNADCNDSEFYRHLGLGHLLTEAFILATYRSLPREHPLYVLMTPNFQGTLFTNNMAVKSINTGDSYLNVTMMIFSGTMLATLGIAGNAVSEVNYNDTMLRRNLRLRGVNDPDLLPNYPYRDDALLIHKAIRRFVRDYVDLYYQSDEDVTGDYELQNWVMEVSSIHGARIRGVGDVADGRIETRAYLINLVAEVIYIASCHHALTNFPLADYEIYEPGLPGSLYAPPPTDTKPRKRKDWLGYLAFINIAILQQALGFVVGSTYFTRLGYYQACHFNDPRVAGPLYRFQADLAEAEEIIDERNETRLLKYPYLLPSRIPASTNI